MGLKILTPCPPKKHCHICESRLSQVFGSADKTNKYRHQASEAGLKACIEIWSGHVDAAVALTVRAASFAGMALDAQAKAAA